jgi:hypothetical protein
LIFKSFFVGEKKHKIDSTGWFDGSLNLTKNATGSPMLDDMYPNTDTTSVYQEDSHKEKETGKQHICPLYCHT